MADIEDVAREAQVSPATVSRVINGRPIVAAATRKRVLAAIARLNYRPNSLGRSLATQRTATLGLVISDITNPYFPEIVRAVEQTAASYEMSVLLYDTAENSDREEQAVRLLAARKVDGVVICASRLSRRSIATLAGDRLPIVLINRWLTSGVMGVVDVDQEAGVRNAVQHLVHLGHRQIAYIGGPSSSQVQQRRLTTFLVMCTELGITPLAQHIVEADPTINGGKDAAYRLIKPATSAGGHTPHPTAILAYNDLIAVGTLIAAQELGVAVPQRLSVIGHDDIPLAGMLHPALTTVQQPARELGTEAVHMLCTHLQRRSTMQEAPRFIRLAPALIVRASTAEAPACAFVGDPQCP